MTIDVPELSDRALRREAEAVSGLHDWGTPSFAANLQLLLDSCRATADLTPQGWEVLRKVAVRHLRNQLYVHAAAAQLGGAAAEAAIRSPLVITGLPRTGTTLLHNLLAADPANRVLRVWEALNPVPPDGQPRPERIGRAEVWLERMYAASPGFRTVHPLSADGPQECDALLQNTFASQHWDDMFAAESYSAWLNFDDLVDEYRFLSRQLVVLSAADEPPVAERHWVLKSPSHLGYLDTVEATFPGALIVFCHRNLAEAIGSYASLVAAVRRPQTAAMTPQSVGAHVLRRSSAAMGRALAARDRLGEDRFIDVAYTTLVSEPQQVIEAIYARVGRTLSGNAADAMRAWLPAHPAHQFGAHRYNLVQYGLDAVQVERALGDYCRRFAGEVA